MKNTLYTETAMTPEEQAIGLMKRKYLPKNAGMIFDFGRERPLQFWMSKTYIPLQIAFIDSKGKIGQIESMVPMSTHPVLSKKDYRFALEVNEGWFNRNGIEVGAQMDLFGPGLAEEPPDIMPDIPVIQSLKEILKAVSDYGMKVIIEYSTKRGFDLPPKTIEPPFEFMDTAEGDADGLLTAWDSQKGRFGSFIIENIAGVKSLTGKPITNTEQIRAMYFSTPPSQEDEDSVRGKLEIPRELEEEQ